MADRNLELAILIRTEVRKALSDLQKVNRGAQQNRQSLDRAGGGADRYARALDRAKKAALGFVSIAVARRLIAEADAYNVLQQRIKTATKETGDYETVSSRIFEISQENGAALQTTVSIYQSVARSAEELGASSADVLTFTDTVEKLGVIGGSTNQQMRDGLRQLSQAMAANIVRAEEYNSVVENIPELAARIADGLGVSQGKLRAMVVDGKLLSKDVFQVILQIAQEIGTEFAAIDDSVERSSQTVANSLGRLIAKVDEVAGITDAIIDGLQAASEALDSGDAERFLDILVQIGAVVGSIGLAKLFGGALTGALVFAGALTNVNRTLLVTEARLALVTRGALALRGVMGLLGGPGGLIILAASALAFFATRARAGERDIENLNEEFKRLTKTAEDFRESELRAAIEARVEEIQRLQAELVELQTEMVATGQTGHNSFDQWQVKGRIDDIKRLGEQIAVLQAQLDALQAPKVDQGLNDETSVLDLTRAKIEAETQIVKAGLEAQLRELERAQEQNLVSYRDYYRERARIQTAAIDAEIRATRAALEEARKEESQAADDRDLRRAKEEQIKLEAELAVLRKQRAEVAVAAAAEEKSAEQELADELAQIRVRLLEAQGRSADARKLAVEQEFKDLRERLETNSKEAGLAMVENLINVESARAELQALEQQVDLALQRMANQEAGIDVELNAGLLTEIQAREKIVALHQRTAAEVEALIPKMRELADATGDERAKVRLEGLATEVKSLTTVVNEEALRIRGAVESNLVDSLADFELGAGKAKEAAKDFFRSLISDLQRLAAERLVLQLSGFFAAGGGGGFTGSQVHAGTFHSGGTVGAAAPTRAISPLAFVGAPRFHGGGFPGLRADERPIIAQLGEEVLRRDDPRNALNGGAQTPVQLRIVNVLDPEMIGEYLQSVAGERIITNVMRRNQSGLRGG